MSDLSTKNFISAALEFAVMPLGITSPAFNLPLIRSSFSEFSFLIIILNKLFSLRRNINCCERIVFDLSIIPMSIGSSSPSLKATIPKMTIGKIRLKIIYCLLRRNICINTFVR